jgi:hypothetical protein
MGRRWKSTGFFLAAFLVPAVAWWTRGRRAGGSQYLAEFWMVDPYRPELGRVGPGGLIGRVADNALAYVTQIIPEGVTGFEGPLLPGLGIALVLLALVGWTLSLRKEASPAELFFPLYAGLICLWPPVWSGDRFALPLLPLLFYYGGVALAWGLARVGTGGRRLAGAVAVAILLLPASSSWAREARQARACAHQVRGGEPFSCYALPIQEYAAMARWASENLPTQAVVVTRKPRIFFLLSRLKAQSVPLTTQWNLFRESVAEKGSRYLTLDRWGGLTARYMVPMIQARPSSFCWITSVGISGQEGTQLLGILPEGAPGEGGEPALVRCPEGMVLTTPREGSAHPPGSIPLLLEDEG